MRFVQPLLAIMTTVVLFAACGSDSTAEQTASSADRPVVVVESYSQKTTLGMTDEQLAALTVPATLILHHGQEVDYLHPIPNSRAATTLLQNSTFEFASTLHPILELLLPFVREHTPALK